MLVDRQMLTLICISNTYKYNGIGHKQRILDTFAEAFDHGDAYGGTHYGVGNNYRLDIQKCELQAMVLALPAARRIFISVLLVGIFLRSFLVALVDEISHPNSGDVGFAFRTAISCYIKCEINA